MNDDDIRSMIRRTHPDPEFPASFQREVWARIAVAEKLSWAARGRRFCQALFLWLARPAPAFATVAVTLGLGIGLGSVTARDSTEAMRTAYMASINPLTASHADMPE
jgi:hypothetical protein